jgi:ACS family sodium-dependent inorganic phosphate cotransporter
VSTSGRGEDRGGEENTLSGIPYLWRSIPVRYQVIIGMALAFVTCNMDRVNISVAIIPMSIDYDWSPTQMGLIQSAFFYGYLVAQIPGGWLANKFGGEKVLPFGVFLWSVATVAVPFLAGDMGGLYLSRAAVGLGEGISPPAAVDVIARTVPVNERSRATTFVFGSMHVGTISGLLLAPVLIKTVGWPSVFIVFGSLGLVWCKWFDDFNSRNKLGNVDQEQKALSADGKAIEGEKEAEEKKMAVAKTTKDKHKQGGGGGKIPWLQFANNTPIRALAYIHFCNNWAQYTILAWLPTFYKDSLGIELTEAAQLSLLPAAMGIVVSLVAAPLADGLVEKGVAVTWVRKFVQSVAFLGPSACMVACMLDSQDQQLVTWLLPVGIGLQAFSLAGLYCNHQDISPRYAAVLSGATHIFGSLPGVFGVPFTGWLLDHTDHSWNLSMFLPCLFFYLSGCVVFLKWGSGEEVAFDLENTVK